MTKRTYSDFELNLLRERIKENPLCRENTKEGREYDLINPFFEAAYYMVNGVGYKNIVVKTSNGLVVEATKDTIRHRQSESKIVEIAKFDPHSPEYLIGKPFFVNIAHALSYFIHDALSHNQSVDVRFNIPSPFVDEDYQI